MLAATMLAIFAVPVLFVTIARFAYSKKELTELTEQAKEDSQNIPFIEQ